MKVYPVKVECVDESDDSVFTITTFDEKAAEIELRCLLTYQNIDRVLGEIKRAFHMLELEE